MPRPTEGYRLADGTPVPGVSTIAGLGQTPEPLIRWAWQLGREGLDYRVIRDTAAEVGTLAHAQIEAWLRGAPAPEGADAATQERAAHALSAFRRWCLSAEYEVVPVETPLVSERYRYGGTPDAWALSRRGRRRECVLDFKTYSGRAQLHAKHMLQVGGYAILLREAGIARPTGAIILQLPVESPGNPTVHVLDRQQLTRATRAFLAALELYHALRTLV